jgi:hypothetical protein
VSIPNIVRALLYFPVSCLVLLLCGCGRGKDATEQDHLTNSLATMSVVLPLSEGHRLLTACDGSQVIADSLWTPPDSVLHRVESRLASYWERFSDNGAMSRSLELYSLQFFGIQRGGEKFVFINGVHQSYLQLLVDRDTLEISSREMRLRQVLHQFRTQAIQVCDGNAAFFRAMYDSAHDTISAFSFNGSD